MRIIPAIDLIDGKCVRLTRGDYQTKKVYNENPLEVAREFEANGIKFLHLVDLDGARASRIINHKVLEAISTNTSLQIDFGGGIKSDTDIRIAFESGAHQVTGGSIALKQPELFLSWLQKFGSDKIILGADSHDRKIMTQGWQEGSGVDVMGFIADYVKQGVQYVIPTDIARDGMLEGPSVDLYKEMLSSFEINLIASGGVASMSDLKDLAAIGCDGVIIGKAIYEGRISLNELSALC
jgi:phosphoribosylformimino-5-aminoimidazole carboxamide ribotide isomerase